MSANGGDSAFDRLRFGIGFTRFNTLGELVVGGMAAIIIEITLGIQRIIEAFLGGIAFAVETIINIGLGLWAAIVGGPIQPIEFSFQELGPLAVDQFGIFAPPVVVAIGLATIYIFIQFMQEEETGNLVPGLRDVPFVGRDEESTEDE